MFCFILCVCVCVCVVMYTIKYLIIIDGSCSLSDKSGYKDEGNCNSSSSSNNSGSETSVNGLIFCLHPLTRRKRKKFTYQD